MLPPELVADPRSNDISDGGVAAVVVPRLVAVVAAPFAPLLPLLLQSDNTVALALRLLDNEVEEDNGSLALCSDEDAGDVDGCEVEGMSTDGDTSKKEEEEEEEERDG